MSSIASSIQLTAAQNPAACPTGSEATDMLSGVGAITGGIGIILLSAALLMAAIYLIHRYLSGNKRPWAFMVVFIAVFICACFENWDGSTAQNILGLPTLILTALGNAVLAFVGGNSFTVLPSMMSDCEPGEWLGWISGDPGHALIHIAFILLNILAFALVTEALLSTFTNFWTFLRTTFHRYDDVVIVKFTDDMHEQAQSFIDDLTEQNESDLNRKDRTGAADGTGPSGRRHSPRHLILRIRLTPGDDDSRYSIVLGDGHANMKRKSLEPTLTSALTHKRSRRETANTPNGSALTSVVFRNGRITVFKYDPDTLDKHVTGGKQDMKDAAHELITGTATNLTNDTYSYSVREIQIRQLIRHIADDALNDDTPQFKLGLRRLNAMIVGDDVESVVLMAVYLIRNGQSLEGYPTIHIASEHADIIEERLRCAYPALFADTMPEHTYPLTPPATFTFHHTVFEMVRSVTAPSDGGATDADGQTGVAEQATLVVFTSPDTGRAPSQRAIIARALRRRFGTLKHDRLLFVQYSEDEPAGYVHENEYGGRENPGAKGTRNDDGGTAWNSITVRLYGDIAETVSARVLLHSELDTRAMLINGRYSDLAAAKSADLIKADESDLTQDIRNGWNDCSLYDRESSRAAADFIPIERRVWEAYGTKDTEQVKEQIGRLEHLRWNAYMVTNGFVPKPCDVTQLVRERDEAYDALHDLAHLDDGQLGKYLKDVVRIDESAERHLALVDWSYLLQVDAAITKLNAMPFGGNDRHPRADIHWTPLRENDMKITDNLLKNPGE